MSNNVAGYVHHSCNCLFVESRRLADTTFFPSVLQIKQYATFCPPRLTKLFLFHSFKVYSLQFCHGFCSKSASNENQGKNTAHLKKEKHSHHAETASKLSHIDSKGHAQMVDVSAKEDTSRVAVATAMVYLGPKTFHLVKENRIQKGDVLTVAQFAGIMASKMTSSLIPLCHNIHITHSEVNLELDDENFAVCITGSTNSVGKTGVEMESLTAVTVAALTVYDMCKAVSREIVISDVKLLKKSGGKSGDYVAS